MEFIFIILWVAVAIGLHFIMKKQYPIKEEWGVKKKQYHKIVYFYLFPALFAPVLISMVSAAFSSFGE